MKTIYKYSISTDTRETKIWVPVGSTPIFTALDPNKVPSIWVEVDDEVDDEEEMCIVVVGTGIEVPSNEYKYLGSFIEDNTFVWHIYTKTYETP
tara:strand:- start:547 stop:828 length:282 start_codon:yes stop_codon:yes gene_type:complete